ncbi:acetylglutamate kinase [Engelhardtia mirabilis]|uniref:Acetylglutamate kinase n=1 Tax=Engelhardtia mirabilis TaxID=2528011 RepID=A0A518BQ07_9BACT|nr:Acetylglutamate kinase [Planctomycetes bacterium Pla133]QDV03376.1 Acetylglutamate kinase [Planctomycetes bacterium Pla86]
MRMLVKVGGAVLDEPDARSSFARSVAQALAAGHELVIVHGGGRQLGRMCADLGLVERRWRGLRVTDARTAEVALAILGGSVNRILVRALEVAGVSAAGLSGADGALFDAEPLHSDEVDLGYVGQVSAVNSKLLEHLLAGGFVPVVATVGPHQGSAGGDEPFLNVNADHAAGALARAIDADVLLLLTDVPALLDGKGQRVACATLDRLAELDREGTIEGGMIPKVEGALAALTPPSRTLVKIAPWAGEDAIRGALQSSVGTVLLSNSEVVGRG